jgi:hypothetical protein
MWASQDGWKPGEVAALHQQRYPVVGARLLLSWLQFGRARLATPLDVLPADVSPPPLR